MELHLSEGRIPVGYARFGSIWKKGEVTETDFRLRNEAGEEVPVQSKAAAFWPDGSIKWAFHEADSARMGKQVRLTCHGEEAVKEEAKTEEGRKKQEASEREGTTGKICQETAAGWQLTSPVLSVEIPKNGDVLFRNLKLRGKCRVEEAYLRLILEKHFKEGSVRVEKQYPGRGIVTEAVLEENGPLVWCFKLSGTHETVDGEKRLPFIVRLRFYGDLGRIDLQHTFLFDGDEQREFLKGIGIALKCPMEGQGFDRHVRMGSDYGSFHETSSLSLVWDHKHPGSIYERQMAGLPLEGYLTEEEFVRLKDVAERSPVWDAYELTQDSDMHFGVRKRTVEEDCCYLDALHGRRAPGTLAFGDKNGSILLGKKDFWQKYPSGMELTDFSKGTATATMWIYAPAARAYDYRHYDHKAYMETCYEGFSDYGATPYGIANTNECSIAFSEKIIPTEEELADFGRSVQDAPVYFASPEYYHEHRAFGYWSLPDTGTEGLKWLEEELDRAIAFYEKEVEVRHWYGIYDYGDVMHTYDKFRHIWRYDIGGYAWQNTELMPTMWLWLAFLRTGRGDILRMAEAMTRHASDVDVYHLGELKGLGTRHGIRHWGCPCKEIRIGMAAHYRFPYYLLGDARFEEVFEDIKDADRSLVHMDPLRYVYPKEQNVLPTHARSGPDWSAMVSNWMTEWERKQDRKYLQKILVGMQDIIEAPLGLLSGPDFEYDPETSHLRYIGESATGGTHLQIALGAPQVWMELADLLEGDDWQKQLVQYGRFYYLSPEEKQKESGGLIGNRVFLYPIMAATMAAYSAAKNQDKELAHRTVQYLFRALLPEESDVGFETVDRKNAGNQPVLSEIPWISTNFTAQWCLNMICALEFVKDAVPKTLKEVREMLADFPKEELFRNC